MERMKIAGYCLLGLLGLTSVAMFVVGEELIARSDAYRGGRVVQIHPAWADVGTLVFVLGVVGLIVVGVTLASVAREIAPPQPQAPWQPGVRPPRWDEDRAIVASRISWEQRHHGPFRDARHPW